MIRQYDVFAALQDLRRSINQIEIDRFKSNPDEFTGWVEGQELYDYIMCSMILDNVEDMLSKIDEREVLDDTQTNAKAYLFQRLIPFNAEISEVNYYMRAEDIAEGDKYATYDPLDAQNAFHERHLNTQVIFETLLGGRDEVFDYTDDDLSDDETGFALARIHPPTP